MGLNILKKIRTVLSRRTIVNSNINRSVIIDINASIHNSNLDDYVYIGRNTQIIDSNVGKHSYVASNAKVKMSNIGTFCSIGSEVQIGLGFHPTDFVSTHPSFYSNNKGFKTFSDNVYFKEYENISIGSDVWIGSRAMIMGGIVISDGAIIAAGSIVTKDIPPYAIVAGVPAKIVKFRFDDIKIANLLSQKWWNNDEIYFEKEWRNFINKH